MKYFSIVLQGVVDGNKNFVIIDVGSRGKQYDATTFRYSKLFHLLEKKKFYVPKDSKFPHYNVRVPFVFIGDEAYLLKTYFMRPYSKKQLTPVKQTYRYTRLSAAQKCIECAFGILWFKWRFLSNQNLLVLCLLYNIVWRKDKDTDIDYLSTFLRVHDNIELEDSVNFTRLWNNRSNNNSDGFLAKSIWDKFAEYIRTFSAKQNKPFFFIFYKMRELWSGICLFIFNAACVSGKVMALKWNLIWNSAARTRFTLFNNF